MVLHLTMSYDPITPCTVLIFAAVGLDNGNGNGNSNSGGGGGGGGGGSDGSAGSYIAWGLLYAGLVGAAFVSRGLFFKETAPPPAVAVRSCCSGKAGIKK